MNLNQVTLPATDVERSAAFYRRLGLIQIVESLPGYARFESPTGSATLSLLYTPDFSAPHGFVVYFECDDLDGTVQRLLRKGVVFDSLPEDKSWLWREAHLRDPDGNTLCLFYAGKNRRYPPWRLGAASGSGETSSPDRAASYTITFEEEPDPGDVRIISDGLTEHALPVVGSPGFKPIAAFARDGQGAIVGGLVAMINWNWLHLTLLWVAESRRGTGLGRELLSRVEQAGRERGCTNVHLDTFSYQARPFYERQGYELFATLDNYPTGQQRFFMRKVL